VKRILRRTGWYVVLLSAVYAVVRGAIELATIHWGNPASYRHDWGGPSLLGVLLVHSGPGVVGAALLVLAWRRYRGAGAAPR
jgi:hypothetical protein